MSGEEWNISWLLCVVLDGLAELMVWRSLNLGVVETLEYFWSPCLWNISHFNFFASVVIIRRFFDFTDLVTG